MKILFIHCNINSYTMPHIVPGIAGISSFLKQAGHQTGLIFLQEAMDRESFLARVRTEAPDLIGFSSLTVQWSLIRQYTRWIRETFDTPIIHGGTHVTVAPEETIQCPEVDLICVGEGEGAMQDLAERLAQGRPFDDIPNLWVKKPDGRIIKNPLRTLIQDLDSLPFPDREIFNFPQLLKDSPQLATLFMAGRGCPYRCTYCVNNALHKIYRGIGRYVRLRSQENVLAEIKAVQQAYGLERLWMYDDTFTYNHKWLQRFCEMYGREIGLPFSVNVRLDTIDEKLLRLLHDAGCDMMVAGIESGNERVRTKILGRRMSNNKIIDTYAMARKLGMRTWAYYIVGIPTETPAEAADTVAMHKQIKPDMGQVTVFYPCPGTDLYDLCQREGYLTQRENTSFFHGYNIVNLPTITPGQIEGFVKEINESHHRHILEKDPQGEFDFLHQLPSASIETENQDFVRLTSANLNGEERLVLFAHPESKVSYVLDLPAKARLVFGMGFYPDTWSPEKGTGVHFEIQLKTDGREQTIFSRYVDPKNNPEDRKWLDEEIDLSNFTAGKTEISFITTTRGGDKSHCWAFWSRPAIYAGKTAAQVAQPS